MSAPPPAVPPHAEPPPAVPPLVTVAGAGHLGRSVLAGLLAAGHPAHRLRATTRTAEQAERLARSHPVGVSTDNGRAARDADVLVVTVRPAQADEVLALALPGLAPGAAVVSFVAGRPLDRLLPGPARSAHAFRVASNAASVERGGLLALSSARGTPGHVHARVTALLEHLGTVVEIPEDQQDLAASTLGSGAAFLALAASGIGSAATRAGAEYTHARAFAADALESAAALLRRADASGAAAWESLATAGGITEAGLSVLLAARTAPAMADAVHAAVARAGELAAGEVVAGELPAPT